MSDMSLLLANEASVDDLPAFVVAATKGAMDDETPPLVDHDDDDGDDGAGFSVDEDYAFFCALIARFGVSGFEFVHVYVRDLLAVGPDLVVCSSSVDAVPVIPVCSVLLPEPASASLELVVALPVSGLLSEESWLLSCLGAFLVCPLYLRV